MLTPYRLNALLFDPCMCPDNDAPYHVRECPRYSSCGGWTIDSPPCGGCDWCMEAQDAYYESLARQEAQAQPQEGGPFR